MATGIPSFYTQALNKKGELRLSGANGAQQLHVERQRGWVFGRAIRWLGARLSSSNRANARKSSAQAASSAFVDAMRGHFGARETTIALHDKRINPNKPLTSRQVRNVVDTLQLKQERHVAAIVRDALVRPDSGLELFAALGRADLLDSDHAAKALRDHHFARTSPNEAVRQAVVDGARFSKPQAHALYRALHAAQRGDSADKIFNRLHQSGLLTDPHAAKICAALANRLELAPQTQSLLNLIAQGFFAKSDIAALPQDRAEALDAALQAHIDTAIANGADAHRAQQLFQTLAVASMGGDATSLWQGLARADALRDPQLQTVMREQIPAALCLNQDAAQLFELAAHGCFAPFGNRSAVQLTRNGNGALQLAYESPTQATPQRLAAVAQDLAALRAQDAHRLPAQMLSPWVSEAGLDAEGFLGSLSGSHQFAQNFFVLLGTAEPFTINGEDYFANPPGAMRAIFSAAGKDTNRAAALATMLTTSTLARVTEDPNAGTLALDNRAERLRSCDVTSNADSSLTITLTQTTRNRANGLARATQQNGSAVALRCEQQGALAHTRTIELKLDAAQNLNLVHADARFTLNAAAHELHPA